MELTYEYNSGHVGFPSDIEKLSAISTRNFKVQQFLQDKQDFEWNFYPNENM
jgi:hypothetical protein